MIIKILDKLAMLNNQMVDEGLHIHAEKGKWKQISLDVAKYLYFFEVFIQNRFN